MVIKNLAKISRDFFKDKKTFPIFFSEEENIKKLVLKNNIKLKETLVLSL